MADIKTTGEKLLLEWKIKVFYSKMTLFEYNIRKDTLEAFCKDLGMKTIRPIGWVELRRILRAKDPSLKVPPELQKIAYRGKR